MSSVNLEHPLQQQPTPCYIFRQDDCCLVALFKYIINFLFQGCISAEDIDHDLPQLHERNIRWLTTKQIQGINPAKFQLLSPEQLAAFTPEIVNNIFELYQITAYMQAARGCCEDLYRICMTYERVQNTINSLEEHGSPNTSTQDPVDIDEVDDAANNNNESPSTFQHPIDDETVNRLLSTLNQPSDGSQQTFSLPSSVEPSKTTSSDSAQSTATASSTAPATTGNTTQQPSAPSTSAQPTATSRNTAPATTGNTTQQPSAPSTSAQPTATSRNTASATTGNTAQQPSAPSTSAQPTAASRNTASATTGNTAQQPSAPSTSAQTTAASRNTASATTGNTAQQPSAPSTSAQTTPPPSSSPPPSSTPEPDSSCANWEEDQEMDEETKALIHHILGQDSFTSTVDISNHSVGTPDLEVISSPQAPISSIVDYNTLTIDQLKSLNIEEMSDEDKQKLVSLNDKKFRKLLPAQINSLRQLLTPQNINQLLKPQIQAIAMEDLTNEQKRALLNRYNDLSDIQRPAITDILCELPVNNIPRCQEYFFEREFRVLTDEQLQNIDTSQLSNEQIEALSRIDQNIIAVLTNDQIFNLRTFNRELLEKFSPGQLQELNVRELDPSKVRSLLSLEQKQLEVLTPGQIAGIQGHITGRTFEKLSQDQIRAINLRILTDRQMTDLISYVRDIQFLSDTQIPLLKVSNRRNTALPAKHATKLIPIVSRLSPDAFGGFIQLVPNASLYQEHLHGIMFRLSPTVIKSIEINRLTPQQRKDLVTHIWSIMELTKAQLSALRADDCVCDDHKKTVENINKMLQRKSELTEQQLHDLIVALELAPDNIIEAICYYTRIKAQCTPHVLAAFSTQQQVAIEAERTRAELGYLSLPEVQKLGFATMNPDQVNQRLKRVEISLLSVPQLRAIKLESCRLEPANRQKLLERAHDLTPQQFTHLCDQEGLFTMTVERFQEFYERSGNCFTPAIYHRLTDPQLRSIQPNRIVNCQQHFDGRIFGRLTVDQLQNLNVSELTPEQTHQLLASINIAFLTPHQLQTLNIANYPVVPMPLEIQRKLLSRLTDLGIDQFNHVLRAIRIQNIDQVWPFLGDCSRYLNLNSDTFALLSDQQIAILDSASITPAVILALKDRLSPQQILGLREESAALLQSDFIQNKLRELNLTSQVVQSWNLNNLAPAIIANLRVQEQTVPPYTVGQLLSLSEAHVSCLLQRFDLRRPDERGYDQRGLFEGPLAGLPKATVRSWNLNNIAPSLMPFLQDKISVIQLQTLDNPHLHSLNIGALMRDIDVPNVTPSENATAEEITELNEELRVLNETAEELRALKYAFLAPTIIPRLLPGHIRELTTHLEGQLFFYLTPHQIIGFQQQPNQQIMTTPGLEFERLTEQQTADLFRYVHASIFPLIPPEKVQQLSLTGILISQPQAMMEIMPKINILKPHLTPNQKEQFLTNFADDLKPQIAQFLGMEFVAAPANPAEERIRLYGVDILSLGNIELKNRKLEIYNKINEAKDHHAALLLLPSDDRNAVKSAYKKLPLITHPDKNPSPEAARAHEKVNKAFAALK